MLDVGKEVGVSMILFFFFCTYLACLAARFTVFLRPVLGLNDANIDDVTDLLAGLLVVRFFMLPLAFRRTIVRFTLGLLLLLLFLFLFNARLLLLLASALLTFMANTTPAAVALSPTDAPFAVIRFIAACSSFLSAKYLSSASVD